MGGGGMRPTNFSLVFSHFLAPFPVINDWSLSKYQNKNMSVHACDLRLYSYK